MYRALYRKWRPQRFEDVVAQRGIVTALRNQIATGRVGHAYLFTGVRGTGKTSCAKIFAKAVNCLHPQNGDPCGECEICKGIDNGSILDVVEMDAASNNGVDDIRDLRDETAYTPSACRYKVYIIDEVHMLSTAAFNALLKTLEEPPPHVTFILATTEPHKIPATIISRCQRMDFHRLGVSDMVKRTEEVLQRENAHIERDGLLAIARAAEGGMRDCLSLADQCLSFCGNNVSTQDVYSVLGSMEDGFLFDMAEAVLSSDPARALELLDQVVRDGRDLKVFLHDLTQHMRSLLLTKLCGHCSDILDCTEDSMKRYEEQAKEAGETRLLRCSELLLQAEGRLRTVTMPRALIESTLVRISRPEEKRTMDDLMERIEVLERQVREGAPRRTAIAEPIPIGEKPDADEYPCDYGFEEPPEPEDVPPFDMDEPVRNAPAPAPAPEEPAPTQAAKPAETAGSMSPQKLWKAILDKLGETERTMAVSGMYGKGSAINGNVLEVAFESEIIYRMMSAPGALEKVNGAADKVAPGYTVRMTHSSGGDDIESTGRALFGSNFRIEN